MHRYLEFYFTQKTGTLFQKINWCRKTFDSSYCEDYQPILISKNKNVLGMTKDKFGDVIMMEFIGIPLKMYSYLTMIIKLKKRRKILW